jgi:flagellar protein FlgJ
MGNLKLEAGKNTPAAIRETAKQFESLFMRELMKSMRDATMKSGMLDSPGGNLGTDLLDQQFAVQMSGQPGGLSDLITLQLTRQMGVQGGATPEPKSTSLPGKHTAAVSPEIKKVQSTPTRSQSTFVERHAKVASEVESATGIPAAYMLGQAGHETGWGKFEIKQKGGAPAFNLFGIKAGSNWTGKVAEVTTTEYVNGVAEKRVARFRAYDSYAESFKDYARLISDSPRYAKAKLQTNSVHAFASGLQKAGYATDPDYAAKLSRAINATIALRRAQT